LPIDTKAYLNSELFRVLEVLESKPTNLPTENDLQEAASPLIPAFRPF